MTDLPGFDAEADAIREAFAIEVLYTGAGLAGVEVLAVKSDVPADAFQGAGSSLRQILFEIGQSALPQEPAQGDLLAEGGDVWRVTEVRRRDDVRAWELVVSRT